MKETSKSLYRKVLVCNETRYNSSRRYHMATKKTETQNEEFSVNGKSLMEKIAAIIREGNVRKITVKK